MAKTTATAAPAKPAKPAAPRKDGRATGAAKLAPVDCPECGATFERRHVSQIFCAETCKAAFHNRSMKRGKEMMPLVLAARMDRGSGDQAKKAFSDWVFLADKFNAEDKAAVGFCRSRKYVARRHELGIGINVAKTGEGGR